MIIKLLLLSFFAMSNIFNLNCADNEKIEELLKCRDKYSAECNILVDILSDIIKFSPVEKNMDELDLNSLKVYFLSSNIIQSEELEYNTKMLKEFSNALQMAIPEAKAYHDAYLIDSLPSIKESGFICLLKLSRSHIK